MWPVGPQWPGSASPFPCSSPSRRSRPVPPLVVASELGLLVGSTVAFGVGAVLLTGVRRRLDGSRRLSPDPPSGPGGEPFIPW